MMKLVIVLLVIWLVLSVLGFVIEGILWLGFIGLILFLGTAIYGFVKRSASGRRS